MIHTKHFNVKSDKKLVCPCCGKGELSTATFILLEVIRAWAKAPVTINSACRCRAHNRAVGGKTNSSHIYFTGDWDEPEQETTAVDIVVAGKTPKEVYDFIDELPYSNLLGLGSYETFTHVDTRGYKARW